MKKLLYSSLAIAAMAVSCQEAELENNGAANNGEVFRISAALPETKTTLNPNDYTVAWESSDELTVIVNSNTAYKFTNAGGDNFEATGVALENGTNTFHVLYPYSKYVESVDADGVTSNSKGKTYVDVPSEAAAKQTGINSTEHVKGVMYGYGTVSSSEETPSIMMNQLTALLKIDVKNDYGETINVQRINVSTDAKGELLSGTFYINLENGTVESSGETYTHNYTILEVENGQIPAGATATFWVSANPFKVPAGSKLTISVDAEQGVVTDERTYEQELVFEAGTVNKTTFDYTTPSGIEKLTVAEFLAKPTGATYYELTGTISNISDTEYGNFDLVDETGSVYVYGLTASKVASNDKSFSTLGLREGDILTLYGTRAAYKGDPQVGGPAYYISHVAVPYCDVTPSTLSVDAAAGETTFSIESNESWSIESDNSSYTVSPASGNGDAEITVTYPANETDEAITVTFTVTSDSGKKTVTLTQRSSSQIPVEVTDVLTADLFAATDAKYTEFSNVKVSSSVVYAGKSAMSTENDNAIQLRSKESDCGIVTTASGGKVKTIEIKWNDATTNARILWIYGSNEPYTSATELYESNLKGERIAEIAKSDGLSQTFEVTDDYSYIGLRSSDGAMYIDSITITWEE